MKNQLRTFFRLERRVVGHEEAFAEPSHRLDIPFATGSDECLERLLVIALRVPVPGFRHFGG